MEVIANQRYQSIKGQLDKLHYCQPFNIESCALVERLLTDLLKTTEAYKKSQNELSIITNENKLNQQALIPLQKENERLTKENNLLHFDVIKTKEELEQIDLKWKSTLRQLQNECQDLRFLVEQKDIKIRKLDQELTKMRSKFEKTLSKMYLPSQDEVIEALAPDMVERGEINAMAKGHLQEFEMSHPLSKFNNDISDLVHDESFVNQANGGHDQNVFRSHQTKNINEANNAKKWAEELARADERMYAFRTQLEESQKRKYEVEEKLEALEKQLIIREEEIKRLHNLYSGGQNLEKLNVKYVHETNEKTIAKLQNQVEFLNKENHRLQTQIDFLKGDRQVVDVIDRLKGEIDDLSFENQTLRRDIQECTKLLKDYQEREFDSQRKDQSLAENEKSMNKQLEYKILEIQNEHDKLKIEYERVQALKGAYNADKRAFIDRINELEAQIRLKEQEKIEVENKLQLLEQSSIQYRNEINFWNGKCSTLKRDLEYQEKYLQKYKDDNGKLLNENDYLKVKVDNTEREVQLLRKQINGLQEDNDRINRMYQVVEKDALVNFKYPSTSERYIPLSQPSDSKQESKFTTNNQVNQENLTTMRMGGGVAAGKPNPSFGGGKWKNVDDDYASGNYGPNSSSHRSGQEEQYRSQQQNQYDPLRNTVKR